MDNLGIWTGPVHFTQGFGLACDGVEATVYSRRASDTDFQNTVFTGDKSPKQSHIHSGDIKHYQCAK